MIWILCLFFLACWCVTVYSHRELSSICDELRKACNDEKLKRQKADFALELFQDSFDRLYEGCLDGSKKKTARIDELMNENTDLTERIESHERWMRFSASILTASASGADFPAEFNSWIDAMVSDETKEESKP